MKLHRHLRAAILGAVCGLVGGTVVAVAAECVLRDATPRPYAGEPLTAPLPDLEALRDEALEAWGVRGGLGIEIRYVPFAELEALAGPVAAATWIDEPFRRVRILVALETQPRDLAGVVCHEVGHAVGHWGHSQEPGSVMRAGRYDQPCAPTALDMATAALGRLAWLPARITATAVAR